MAECPKSVQDWEVGLTLPTAGRRRALTQAPPRRGGLTRGQETAEASELWLLHDRCRLVAVLGIGVIGKTILPPG